MCEKLYVFNNVDLSQDARATPIDSPGKSIMIREFASPCP
jgi:hypothetical protein